MMEINKLLNHYAKATQTKALAKALLSKTVKNLMIDGLAGSSCPLLFSAVAGKIKQSVIFILRDADEAGYFYQDLTQLLGTDHVLFFPSSYRRAVKYGQRDAANEILRTEVMSRLAARQTEQSLYIVTHPEAMAEMAVSKEVMNDRSIRLAVNQNIDIVDVEHQLRELGFSMVDYVYEPGQFAVRGSILDVYSFSHELPFRIDFFGDEIDTIRTFEIENQLSKDKKDTIEIVPELAKSNEKKIPLTEFLDSESIIVSQGLKFINDVIGKTYDDGFSSQAMTDRMSGATEQEQEEIRREMNAALNLCPPSRFMQSIEALKKVTFSQSAFSEAELSAQGKKFAQIKTDRRRFSPAAV